MDKTKGANAPPAEFYCKPFYNTILANASSLLKRNHPYNRQHDSSLAPCGLFVNKKISLTRAEVLPVHRDCDSVGRLSEEMGNVELAILKVFKINFPPHHILVLFLFKVVDK